MADPTSNIYRVLRALLLPEHAQILLKIHHPSIKRYGIARKMSATELMQNPNPDSMLPESTHQTSCFFKDLTTKKISTRL